MATEEQRKSIVELLTDLTETGMKSEECILAYGCDVIAAEKLLDIITMSITDNPKGFALIIDIAKLPRMFSFAAEHMRKHTLPLFGASAPFVEDIDPELYRTAVAGFISLAINAWIGEASQARAAIPYPVSTMFSEDDAPAPTGN